MKSAHMFGKSLAFPVRVGDDGRMTWSEGQDNIEESIRLILATDRRERLFRPEFGAGLREFLFEPNTVTTRHLISEGIARALANWEPRIVVSSVDTIADTTDPAAAIATIHYRLVATQAPQSLRIAVRLGG